VIFPPHLPLLHGPDYTKALAAWAAERIPQMAGGDFGPCWAVGVIRSGAIAAVCVYHDWQPHHGVVQLSVAADSPRWASRQVLAALLGVPFLMPLGPGAEPCRKAVAVCASDNARALEFVRGVGFTQEAVLAHQFAPRKHAVVHRMFARDYARRYGGLS
jgi:hypothetical protein